MWTFKGTLWNSTQNILLIHWKIRFLYNIGILRALRFKSSYAFLKRPPRAKLLLLRLLTAKGERKKLSATIQSPSWSDVYSCISFKYLSEIYKFSDDVLSACVVLSLVVRIETNAVELLWWRNGSLKWMPGLCVVAILLEENLVFFSSCHVCWASSYNLDILKL